MARSGGAWRASLGSSCCSEMELVSGTVRSAQSQAYESEGALEVDEEHLDLFPRAVIWAAAERRLSARRQPKPASPFPAPYRMSKRVYGEVRHCA